MVVVKEKILEVATPQLGQLGFVRSLSDEELNQVKHSQISSRSSENQNYWRLILAIPEFSLLVLDESDAVSFAYGVGQSNTVSTNTEDQQHHHQQEQQQHARRQSHGLWLGGEGRGRGPHGEEVINIILKKLFVDVASMASNQQASQKVQRMQCEVAADSFQVAVHIYT